MKNPKKTLKDEAWAGDIFFHLREYFAVCPQRAYGVQGNPLAPAVVSVMWTSGGCTTTSLPDGLVQGCNRRLRGGKASGLTLHGRVAKSSLLHEPLQGMPPPPNLHILISQITVETEWSQDSDGNFRWNLDQNPHGGARGGGRTGSLQHQYLADMPVRVHHSFPIGPSPGQQTHQPIIHLS